MVPDQDLTKLSPEDLARVCRWAEDRFINAICALDMQLQREMPGVMAADRTLQMAKAAVAKVLAGVEEARALARRERTR